MLEKTAEIMRRVQAAKERSGNAQEITIIAATKTVEPERINLLPSCGITVAGENRVQELVEKYDKVTGVEWHLIGALQTNKVKYIIDKVKLIHSVDREALCDEIEKQAAKHNLTMDVLVEINIGGEESKSGVSPENAAALMEYASKKPHLRLKGVMSVLPIGAPDEMYGRMQEFSHFASERYGATVLSMGMSGDFEKAIEHGSNMIRVGSAIFGQRIYQKR